MIDASREVHLRGLERIVGREVDGEKKDTAGVGRITLKKSGISIMAILSKHHDAAKA